MQSGSIDDGGSKQASERGSLEMNSPGQKINPPVKTNTSIEIFEVDEEENIAVASDKGDGLNARNKDENVNRISSEQGGSQNNRPKSSTSGVRLLMRHLNKQKRNVHPTDGSLSPQLVVRDGQFEVFDPEHVLKRKDTILGKNKGKSKSKDGGGSSGCCKSLNLKLGLLKFKYGDLIPIFRQQIKKIEGGYGSGVAAVFRFTRWAILLNLVLSLGWICFLVIPAAIQYNYKLLDSISFSAENVFDGKGKLQYTWMFYGNYPSRVNEYRIDYAYIVLGLLTFFGSLFIILKSTINTDLSTDNVPFTMLTLATWDFSVVTQDARKSTARGITTLAKCNCVYISHIYGIGYLCLRMAQDLLSVEQARTKWTSRGSKQKCWIYTRRFIAWVISSAITTGACYTIYYFLVEVSIADFVIKQAKVEVGKTFLETYGFGFLFSLLNAILPFIIEQLPKMEAYEKGIQVIYVNITRIFLLRFLNLFAMMFTLYTSITASKFRGCGGTFIGQEFYKIILLDMAVATVVQIISKFGLYLIRKRQKKEPDVSRIVLQIVYRQALVWAGTFFCPIVPVLGLLAQCLVFGLNYLIITVTCKAPTKRFKEGIIFFKGCLTFTLLCLLIPITTVFATKYVSIGTFTTVVANGTIVKSACGPFGDRPPMDVFEEGKANLPSWLSKVANWFTSSAVFPAILIMGIIIYIQQLRFKNQAKKYRQLQMDHFEYQKRSNYNYLRAKTKA